MEFSSSIFKNTIIIRETKMPRLNWNGRELDGWVFDGKELKPKSGASSRNTYVWNGKELKPKSGASSSNSYVWTGKELKPKSGASSSNTWVIQSGKAKPKSGASSSNTWDYGTAPIPIVAGKILGLI